MLNSRDTLVNVEARIRSLPQFAKRLPDVLDAAADAESRQYTGHNQFGPRSPGAEYPEGCRDHRDVADGIVARAYPDRPHVRIASAEAIEDERDTDIGRRRYPANNTIVCGWGDAPFTAARIAVTITRPPKTTSVMLLASAAR